jgi:hypothetical protein
MPFCRDEPEVIGRSRMPIALGRPGRLRDFQRQ